jgi:hypothetical protein
MKKLNLNAISSKLTKEQMKKVIAGSGDCAPVECSFKPCCDSNHRCCKGICKNVQGTPSNC